MNMKGKIDLYAKIRHEYRWGVGTSRGLAEMFKVHRRLVRDALDNPLPPKRKIPLRQHTSQLPQSLSLMSYCWRIVMFHTLRNILQRASIIKSSPNWQD